MKSYSNVGIRPLRAGVANFDVKKLDYTPSSTSLQSAKANYSKTAVSSLRKIRFSPISQSSKETQSNSEKSFSQDTSSSDYSKLNAPSSLTSLRDPTPQSSRSETNKNKTYKITSKKPLSNNINFLNEVVSHEELPLKIPPPQITAKCWAVVDGKSGEIIYSRMENRKREVASLTKMMNLLCVCKLIKEFEIDPKETHIRVSKNAASMKGTSAFLKTGDLLSIWDLLHGLMLPSGNDAAMALAENFGTFLYLRSDEYKAKCIRESNSKSADAKNPAKYFIRLMNETANELGMYFTQYANPHGLANSNNYSCASDQAKLSHHILKLDIVREIVNKKSYSCEIEQVDGRLRVVTWENTNKLLHREGWGGVKTGITTAAGPCLSAYYEKEGESYIVILLNSFSMEIRWIEAPKIVEWARKNKAYLK